MAELKALRVGGESRDLPGFLRLPYELRQRIYQECLVEPELWYRPHRATCRLAAKDTATTERPAFVKRNLVDHLLDDCKCTLRRSLALLRVSRLVNREAAHIFWSQNTFCFAHPADFQYDDFCDRVRPAHRLLIRHICVMPYISDSLVRRPTDYNYRSAPGHYYRDESASLRFAESLWQSLLACQGLRTLELHDGLLFGQLQMHASRMRANLPHLHTFRLVALLAYKVWPAQEEVDGLAARKWSKNPLHAKSRSHDNRSEQDSDEEPDDDDADDADDDEDDENGGLDTSIGLDVPIAELGSAMPNHHTSHVAAPPPPPPPVRRLALNPIIPGYGFRNLDDFSRMLWFKVGVTVDDAVIDSFTRGTTPTCRLFPPPMDKRVVKRTARYYNDEWAAYRENAEDEDENEDDEDLDADEDGARAGPKDDRSPQQVANVTAAEDAFKEMLRNFRTNFLVHMRHAIHQDLPYEWGAKPGYTAPLPLREMDALPPKKIIKDVRIRTGYYKRVTVDSPDFKCSKYGSVRRALRSGKTYFETHYKWEFYRYNEHDWDRNIDSHRDPIDDPHGPIEYDHKYGLKRYHPDALRHISKRIPALERDGSFERPDKVTVRRTLRDGTQHDIELFGLPPALEQHRKRLRQRMGYAVRHEKTPEQLEREATARVDKDIQLTNFMITGRHPLSIERRARDQMMLTRLERRSRAEANEAQQKVAESKKAGRARRRDEQTQKAQRQMERKRLPGVASLHAEQKKRMRVEREKQNEEKKKLEDDAEKRMKAQLAKNSRMKQRKAKAKKVDDDDEDVFTESDSDSDSDSDSEDDDKDKDENDDDGEADEAEDEDERWPAPPKWTKPEKKKPRDKRYSGHAYKKCNRKPARLFRASTDDLDLYY
ncbi:ribosomal protein l32 [Ophiostoma piceae UAMH 11346]|uniref:Ribosomal protein l32 n=1 Tax=Ophiostoma piceae (strain UAMH 11346) TaxID=1262450 RepID=S3CWG9_OPHP1|nr:ribosomal protein l32 [Ophiostoma piceae UAMH 11346]